MEGQKPPFERIVDDLRARILSGELRPGDALPSVRELREQYGVSESPVLRAFLVLRVEGLTQTSRGTRVYVRDRSQDAPPTQGGKT